MLSPNLFDSLVMWIAATAAVYLLVSLGWQRAGSAVNALRVVVILTAGDIALTLGVVFTWIKFGVFSSLLAAPAGQTIADPFSWNIISQGVIGTLHHAVASAGPRALAVMGIVFVVAAVLRAAQFPFHVWLRTRRPPPSPCSRSSPRRSHRWVCSCLLACTRCSRTHRACSPPSRSSAG